MVAGVNVTSEVTPTTTTTTTVPSKPTDAKKEDSQHYPMDPGHPSMPYAGPYNPEYMPTPPSVAEIFHLAGGNSEKTAPPLKEKSKPSKSDSKKPVEPSKPHKDVIESQYPGPYAPDKFAEKPAIVKPIHDENNKLDKDQVTSVVRGDSLGPSVIFADPKTGEKVVPPPTYNNEDKPPYKGPIRPDLHDPNNVIVPVAPSSNKKKINPDDEKKFSPASGGKTKPKQPEQEINPEDFYDLINLQHPGLVGLDRGPPQGHPGLYNIHQQINGGQKQQKPSQSDYYGPTAGGSKKQPKPQIYAHRDENGDTTYHIHAHEIPSTAQFEDLLSHISQHDPNQGPFQQYPGQPAIPHNVPSAPSSIVPTHLHHLLGQPQQPGQSGSSYGGFGYRENSR